MILRQRVRGSVRAVRAVRNTWVFQTETKVVADTAKLSYTFLNGTIGILLSSGFILLHTYSTEDAAGMLLL